MIFVNEILVTLLVLAGYLSAYSQRPTDGTIALRQEWKQLPDNLEEYDVFLSVPNCGTIGMEANLIIDDVVYSGIVFDCAGKSSHWWMIDNGIVAEVDYYFWMAHPEFVGSEMVVEVEIFSSS